jgi:hypothetical protein
MRKKFLVGAILFAEEIYEWNNSSWQHSYHVFSILRRGENGNRNGRNGLNKDISESVVYHETDGAAQCLASRYPWRGTTDKYVINNNNLSSTPRTGGGRTRGLSC